MDSQQASFAWRPEMFELRSFRSDATHSTFRQAQRQHGSIWAVEFA
jgi:hypothetical protein